MKAQEKVLRNQMTQIVSEIGVSAFGRLYASVLETYPKEKILYPYIFCSSLEDKEDEEFTQFELSEADDLHPLTEWWFKESIKVDAILGKPTYYYEYRQLCLKFYSAMFSYFSEEFVIDVFVQYGRTLLISDILINSMINKFYKQFSDGITLESIPEFDGEYDGDLDSTLSSEDDTYSSFDENFKGNLDSTTLVKESWADMVEAAMPTFNGSYKGDLDSTIIKERESKTWAQIVRATN